MKKKSRRDAQKNRPPNNHRQLYASVCLTRSLEVLALRLVPHVGRARRREVLACPFLRRSLSVRRPPGVARRARNRGRYGARGRGACRAACTRATARPPLPPARRGRRGRARGDGAGNDDTYMCGVCACLASRLDEWGESHRGTIERLAARTKKDKIVRVSNESRAKREKKPRGDATLFPDTRGPNSRGPTRRRRPRAEPGARASARSKATRPLRAVASRARSRRRAFRVSRSSAGWAGTHPRATTSSSSWRTPSRGRTRCFRRRRPCSPRRDPCARR